MITTKPGVLANGKRLVVRGQVREKVDTGKVIRALMAIAVEEKNGESRRDDRAKG